MNQHYRDTRKIDPTRGTTLGDGTPNDQDRMEIGPTQLAFAEWKEAGLELPDLPAMRTWRHKRLVDAINERDYAGVLVFDPLNIRYATDSTNMQLWNTHNPFRACLICADGYMVIWDYKNARFLSEHNPLVRERRAGHSMFYFSAGDGAQIKAGALADEVEDLLREHGGTNKRLGVDKIMLEGAKALEARGFQLMNGEELTEKARAVKGPDEIKAMRCASHSCEAAIYAMEDFTRSEVPKGNVSEDDIWAVLHAENIKRGGEWIETRLLASGPRTNPWFQECGGRIVQNNEIVAFDTDLVGAYGICVDISRTWWVGDTPARPDMIEAMKHGIEHIEQNMEMLRPGVTVPELVENGHRLAEKYQKQKYSCMMHGVGLCDEWPHVGYPDHNDSQHFDYPIEKGMTLCVEALVSPEGGDFSIKLEDQVVITEDGYENLTLYPFDPRLTGEA